MDKSHFDQLVAGVKEMRRHMAGKPARSARASKVIAPDVRAIREAASISQAQFTKLIGVNSCTPQKLRTTSHAPDTACTRAAENRRE
jgi:DNA-binding transcriptional regulator YiaG